MLGLAAKGGVRLLLLTKKVSSAVSVWCNVTDMESKSHTRIEAAKKSLACCDGDLASQLGIIWASTSIGRDGGQRECRDGN